ncbi:UNVERIFIED_CONTAM: hypothetical protein H355_011307 [Colinus virginianus]|nr:hypothetical protein H355_011307 [Colinus virginianus]
MHCGNSCSSCWTSPGSLASKEKRQALTDMLRQLELKYAALKFRQPPGASSYRKLEAELRVRLQQEKAHLEQARGSYLRQQELHSLLEIAIDNLVARLHGITVPEQEAREKLRRNIFRQVNTCNALLHKVRQRIRARDALRQQLQQLLDVVRVAGKRHQQQLQRICQLENGVEKTRLKIHAGQKVTASYLALRDALKTELRSLLTHVEMLHTVAEAYDREAQHRELEAADAVRASAVAELRRMQEMLQKIQKQKEDSH